MRVVEAPNRVDAGPCRKIFLAGSIEMGKAEQWQNELIHKLGLLPMEYNHELVVFNPRRSGWDPSWEQNINNPKFYEQVSWELDMLDDSDIVVFYFDPATYSPITLMELGYLLRQDKYLVVCCPDGFWRRGNVEIMCSRHNISLADDIGDIIERLKIILGQFP